MTELLDHQFELGDAVFGLRCDVATDGDGFDTGTDDPATQDVFSNLSESYAFGVDSIQPATWIWAMHTDNARTVDEALDHIRTLERAWINACDRRDPGAVAALRYSLAGRTRVVYGRPRRFSWSKTNLLLQGSAPITAEFARSDRLFYADEVQSLSIGVHPPEAEGFTFSLTFPLATLESDPTTSTTPAIGGDVPAPFIATINGPSSGSLVNPKLSTSNWEIELRTTIPAGMSIEVNTYPWAMYALRSDGAIISSLSPRSRLSKARLAIAGETLQFDGIDSSGTATCDIQYRAAYETI